MAMSHYSELIQELIRVLNLPENTISFSIHASVNSVVKVDVSFYPKELKIDPETKERLVVNKKYFLQEIDGE